MSSAARAQAVKLPTLICVRGLCCLLDPIHARMAVNIARLHVGGKQVVPKYRLRVATCTQLSTAALLQHTDYTPKGHGRGRWNQYVTGLAATCWNMIRRQADSFTTNLLGTHSPTEHKQHTVRRVSVNR